MARFARLESPATMTTAASGIAGIDHRLGFAL
jgi:hypothetical protein